MKMKTNTLAPLSKIAHGLVLILLGCLIVLGCSSKDDNPIGTPPGIPSVQWVSKLPNLVFESSNYYLIQAEVAGINLSSVDSVVVSINEMGGSSVNNFRLYDDASAYQLNDDLAFCESHSGDLVAGNGIYTRLVNSKFAPNQGSYIFGLSVWVANSSTPSITDTIMVDTSQPPQISGLVLPDTLTSGFSPFQLSIQAFDPDPPASDSVVAVEMKFYSAAGLMLGSPYNLLKLGNANYGLTLTPDFSAGHASGLYTFGFRAFDTFDIISDSLGKAVYLENLAPSLTNPAFPDTVSRPDPGFVLQVLLTIHATDDQTAADIDSVFMFSRKPDGTMANGGLPIPMLDNGLPFDPLHWNEGYLGDQTALDGIYSTTAVLFDTSQIGTYTFTFQASDFADNISEAAIDSMMVTP